MAHPESVAIGQYVPTPRHLLPTIASPLTLVLAQHEHWSIFDPCAGDGEAIELVARALSNDDTLRFRTNTYAVELEATRFAALRDRFSEYGSDANPRVHPVRAKTVHGDALSLVVRGSASVLFLNPPYDDQVKPRLEEQFLSRFAQSLTSGGVLVLIVPYKALAASAATLASEFEQITVYRFPDEDFAVYKQVVVLARKRPTLFEPDPDAHAWLLKAAENPALLRSWDDLPDAAYAVPRSGGLQIEIAPFDIVGLCKSAKPWHAPSKTGALEPILEVMPARASAARMPVVTPLKPAYIAAAAACGIFDGARVAPNDKASGLPDILVKGVFEKQLVEVGEIVDEDGMQTGEKVVEQPRLVLTALDLSAGTFHTLPSEATRSGSRRLADFTAADLLDAYSDDLVRIMRDNCPVLYDPERDADSVELAPMARQLYTAQEHAAKAAVMLTHPKYAEARRAWWPDGAGAPINPLSLGEVGCLRGDTPIYDPVHGDTRTVAERYLKREGFHVYALGPRGPVITAALPPAKYAPAQMMRVTMVDGSSVTVTPAHRFWDGSRWVRASDVCAQLAEGVDALLATSSGSDLSTHELSGLRWTQTAPNSQDCYRRDRRFCDARPLSTSIAAQSPAPSQDGARARILRHSHQDDPAHELKCNLLCRQFFRCSTKGCAHPAEGLVCSPDRPQHVLQLQHDSDSIQEPAQQAEASRAAHKAREPSPDAQTSTPLSYALGENIDLSEQLQLKKVSKVEPLDAEPYYDFHVPVFNCYWAAGLWHHNSGKSSIVQGVVETIGAWPAIILCPPILTDEYGWIAQIQACFPAASWSVLCTVEDVDCFAKLAAIDRDTRRVAILSREMAKLKHGVAPVTGECPKCGAPLPPDADLAGTRARCRARPTLPADSAAIAATHLAETLLPCAGHAWIVRQVARSARTRFAYLRADYYKERRAVEWETVRHSSALRAAVYEIAHVARTHKPALEALGYLLAAIDDDALTEESARELYDVAGLSTAYERCLLEAYARSLALMLRDNRDAVLRDMHAETPDYWGHALRTFARARADAVTVDGGGAVTIGNAQFCRLSATESSYHDTPCGSVELAIRALSILAAHSKDDERWIEGPECGEFLWQSTPTPRRYPLAEYILRRHKKLFKCVIADELQEYSRGDSAQTGAMHLLCELGVPVFSLSGSACSGYAESLFAAQWARDRMFRERYSRDGSRDFVRMYGYQKGIIEDRDREEGGVVAYGTQSDRVIRSTRMTGNAPGVLPKFLFDYLLRGAVPLHKSDLALDLPRHDEELETVPMTGELAERFKTLSQSLRAEIASSRFKKGRAGKLWGAFAELAYAPDLMIEGVGGESSYEIRYPAELVEGSRRKKKVHASEPGDLVVSAPLFPASTLLAKEAAMLKRVEKEFSAGRRVLLFARHRALVPRLAMLLKRELGEACAVLDVDKVQAGSRQAWIADNIVGKGVRAMALNPVAVKTGINVLVHFQTAIWYQNPGCDALTWRQANGRIDRPGKTLPSLALMLAYDGMQVVAQELLHHKVGVSLATDGLDPRSALSMAGIGADGSFDAYSVAQQLYKRMGWDKDAA